MRGAHEHAESVFWSRWATDMDDLKIGDSWGPARDYILVSLESVAHRRRTAVEPSLVILVVCGIRDGEGNQSSLCATHQSDYSGDIHTPLFPIDRRSSHQTAGRGSETPYLLYLTWAMVGYGWLWTQSSC